MTFYALEVTSEGRGYRGRPLRQPHPHSLMSDRPGTARGHYQGPPPPPSHPPQEHEYGNPHYGNMRGSMRGAQRPFPQRKPPEHVRHRLFVALFDYDPLSMSPNPEGSEEELPFREGQTIKVKISLAFHLLTGLIS